jgi:hypothetical protein
MPGPDHGPVDRGTEYGASVNTACCIGICCEIIAGGYARSLGRMAGVLFTASTAVIALLMGIYPRWLTLETNLVPLQQWGILTAAPIASISLLAGLFRSGAVFAPRQFQS